MIRLGLYGESTTYRAGRAAYLGRNLRLCLAMNSGIHLGPLEQVFPVVAALGVIVGCGR